VGAPFALVKKKQKETASMKKGQWVKGHYGPIPLCLPSPSVGELHYRFRKFKIASKIPAPVPSATKNLSKLFIASIASHLLSKLMATFTLTCCAFFQRQTFSCASYLSASWPLAAFQHEEFSSLPFGQS
jgi:hypothetical protein